jgi:hypothetical protein
LSTGRLFSIVQQCKYSPVRNVVVLLTRLGFFKSYAKYNKESSNEIQELLACLVISGRRKLNSIFLKIMGGWVRNYDGYIAILCKNEKCEAHFFFILNN